MTGVTVTKLARQVRFFGAGQPKDLIREFGFSVVSYESTKAAKELRQRNLSGKKNARMGTAGFLPQDSKLHEVFPVECQDGQN